MKKLLCISYLLSLVSHDIYSSFEEKSSNSFMVDAVSYSVATLIMASGELLLITKAENALLSSLDLPQSNSFMDQTLIRGSSIAALSAMISAIRTTSIDNQASLKNKNDTKVFALTAVTLLAIDGLYRYAKK